MSLIERMEGRRHAAELLQSVAGMPKAILEGDEVIKNMKDTIQRRPGDWAEGVRDVLTVVEGRK